MSLRLFFPFRCLGVAHFVVLAFFTLKANAAEESTAVAVTGPVWKRHTIDRSSKGADGVKLGDLNGDGLPDIVTGWEEGGVVRAYLNPGRAKARDPWPAVTVGKVKSAEDAIFVDLDGDGILDIVSCTEGNVQTMYRHRLRGPLSGVLEEKNWETEAFPVTQKSQQWMQVLPLDVDGQHGIDLIVASKNAKAAVGWLQSPKSPGELNDWKYHRLRDAGWLMSLAAHDMNGDGVLDVVFSDRKGSRTGVFWLQNPGAKANMQHAEWKEHAIGGLGRQVMFADVADLNGDGLIDVAVAAKPNDVFLCLQQPGGKWREQIIHLADKNLGDAKAVKAADVNGDVLVDLFYTCENAKGEREGIVWLEQQKGGTWKQHTLGGPDGIKFDLMQVLDLDGDGDLDVITCEERDQLGVIWYENPTK